jgi:hypothetical protein
MFTTLGPPGEVEHAPEMGGGGCRWGPGPSYGALAQQTGVPFAINVSAGKRPLKPHGATEWVPPVIWGWLNPEFGGTRVEVRWTGGSKALAFANDYFIGAVEELYEPAAETVPFFLVAYDADGQEVARRKLDPVRLD